MKTWIKEHWIEVATFSGILTVLAVCCAPNATWVNTDSDGIHYVYAAKYLYPAHKTSAPLFLLLGHLFLQVPLGSEFWRFAMLSVLASTASAVIVYLIVREKLGATRGKLYGIISALVFGGSALVISQSTIVESYALVTLCSLLGYYFAIKEKWLYCALALGCGIAIHHLIFIPIVVMVVLFKGLRRWKYAGVMASFLLLYLYIPITVAIGNPPNMWGNTEAGMFFADTATTMLMLVGGLSIWDLPKRIFDAVGILGVSLGLAWIAVFYFFIREKHTNENPIRIKWYKEPLFWLLILPVVYYVTDLAPQTYVYLMPAIAFGAVIAGVALYKMRSYWKWAVLACAIGLLAFNAYYLDIGKRLDPLLEANKYYQMELDKVPDGEVLMPSHDWEWASIIPYNKDNDRDILPVCVGVLPSLEYRNDLERQGIDVGGWELTAMYMGWTQSQLSYHVANYIIEHNEVWTTETTDPSNYGIRVVKADISKHRFEPPPSRVTLTWQFKPDNPYDIITGAIEVEKWVNILQSNYSMLTFGMMGGIGFVPCYVFYQSVIKKKKWSLKKKKKGGLKQWEEYQND